MEKMDNPLAMLTVGLHLGMGRQQGRNRTLQSPWMLLNVAFSPTALSWKLPSHAPLRAQRRRTAHSTALRRYPWILPFSGLGLELAASGNRAPQPGNRRETKSESDRDLQ